ncbi:MAG: 50S ribosomal protein L11 methyltransferase [Deltaproteobacteria bacterium]|nr:50S ribosomal protein L11 methyltransferase [Deltaproteobacteria bacterium]
MIPLDATLYVYELRGDVVSGVSDPPASFIGLWNEEEFSYLFFTAAEDAYVADISISTHMEVGARHEMKYADWQAGLPAGGIELAGVRFVSADHPSPPPGSVVLDPSVVFGDGTHPTTAATLGFLRELVQSHGIGSMLDLGTGTGILALAAASMGMSRIVAVDKNKLAVKTAKKNVKVSSYSSVIEVQEGEARWFVGRPFDCVAANLPFQVLRDLATGPGMDLHRFWVVSGINSDQAAVLKDLFVERGFLIGRERKDPPWVTFTAANSALL